MALRFLGNKAKLVNEITNLMIETTNLESGTFVDLFSGTGTVSEAMKIKGFDVISNDMLYSSYIIAKSKILVNEVLNFYNVLNKNLEINEVLKILNGLKGVNGFFTENYSPSGELNGVERKYFTDTNAQKIDAVRLQIKNWYQNGKISDLERAYLLTCLIYAVNDIANISGTYGAFLKKWSNNALGDLYLKPIHLHFSNGTHQVFNLDANKLVKEIPCADIIYLDPPYTKRQYASYYHILETLAKGDNPVIEGITGLRKDAKENTSKFCYKRHALNTMKELVNDINAKHIFISYSTDGHISHDAMLEILAVKGEVKFWMKDYKRFKSSSLVHSTDNLKEILYYVKVCK